MQAKAQRRKPRTDNYSKVFHSRKHRVRGMWIRNGRFFGNVTLAEDLGRKSSKMVPLKGATFEEDRDDYRRLQVERDEDRLRPIGQSPTLGEYIEKSYKRQLKLSGKRQTIISKERGYLKYWWGQLGHFRLNRFRTHHHLGLHVE